DPTVLDAAIRIARAEDATLVPAYLILIPLRFELDAPMRQECAMAIPLLEAVEHAASRANVPVDARVESGRSPIHGLERIWNVEHFDRIVVPAPVGREPGFTPKELLWMLTNAPSETVVLRPDPALRVAEVTSADRRSRVNRQQEALPDGLSGSRSAPSTAPVAGPAAG